MIKKKKNGSVKTIKIDLGCGANKKEGFIGIDIYNEKGVDIVLDLNNSKLPFEDNSVEEIYSSHFFEHVDSVENTLSECVRVLKKGGKLRIIVPHYSNPYSYHFTHKTYWSSYSLNQEYIDYYLKLPLKLNSVKINFANGKFLNYICNFIANKYRSVYERGLNSFIKAWEIEFSMTKIQKAGKLKIRKSNAI